jgi:hypothetical protein
MEIGPVAWGDELSGAEKSPGTWAKITRRVPLFTIQCRTPPNAAPTPKLRRHKYEAVQPPTTAINSGS